MIKAISELFLKASLEAHPFLWKWDFIHDLRSSLQRLFSPRHLPFSVALSRPWPLAGSFQNRKSSQDVSDFPG